MICSKFVEICSKTRDDSGNEHKKLFLLKFSVHSGASNLMFYLVFNHNSSNKNCVVSLLETFGACLYILEQSMEIWMSYSSLVTF